MSYYDKNNNYVYVDLAGTEFVYTSPEDMMLGEPALEVRNPKKDSKPTETTAIVAKAPTDLVVGVTLEKPLYLSDLVSSDDQALTELPAEIKTYSERGLFSPTIGMSQITNRFDGEFYAKIVVKDNGRREVHYMQKYENGTFSPEYTINQEDLFLVIVGETSKDTGEKKEAAKLEKKLRRDYLSRCDGKMEASNFGLLLKVLYSIYQELPIEDKTPEMSAEELYSEVIRIMKQAYPYLWQDKTMRHGGYFVLADVQIDHIAQELKMTSKKLLELLKEYKLLYLLPSSRGYQAKVPMGTDAKTGKRAYDWGYCIYDFEYMAQKQLEN